MSSSTMPSLPSPPKPKTAKLGGYDFYRSIGSPRHIVAPMVDQSELPWRLLSRSPLPPHMAWPSTTLTVPLDPADEAGPSRTFHRHPGGAHLVYTPMIHARVFLDRERGGRDLLFDLTHGEEGSGAPLAGIEGGDRPLFVQFCANDPETLLEAAKLVEDRCDAVDINFGCPQGIARRGHYGAFLQEDWELIKSLIGTLHENLSIPVTAKFRVFPDVARTVAYARMMEAAGAQILTCHGRTREMKGHNQGMADWKQIKAVKEAVSVPVFANGNILYAEDVERCLEMTGCDGVMTAEGNLSNPSLFLPPDHPHFHPPVTVLAHRYLDIVNALESPTGASPIKAHLFRIFKAVLTEHEDLRQRIANCLYTVEDRGAAYRQVINEIEERLRPLVEAAGPDWKVPPIDPETGYRKLPIWVTQPYISSTPKLAEEPNAAAAAAAASAPVETKVTDGLTYHQRNRCIHEDPAPCSGVAATRCTTRACLVHCREIRAVAGGMDPGAAAREAAGGGLVGEGCEAHESKAAARVERFKQKRKAKTEWKKVKKQARVEAAQLDREEGQAV